MIIKIILITLVCFYISFRKDISNYFYIKKCFDLAVEDNFIKINYKNIKRSFLNVLYFYIIVPSNIDDERLDVLVRAKLSILDDFLVASSLDGVIDLEIRNMGEVNEGNDLLYLIKFVQIFENYFKKSIVFPISTVLINIVIYRIDLLYNLWKTIQTLLN